MRVDNLRTDRAPLTFSSMFVSAGMGGDSRLPAPDAATRARRGGEYPVALREGGPLPIEPTLPFDVTLERGCSDV